MRWHFLNPFYTLRIDRENARLQREVDAIEAERKLLVRARDGAKRAADSFYASIGRQAPSGSETDLRSRVVFLDGQLNAAMVLAGLARTELGNGRPSHALAHIDAMLAQPDAEQREAS